MYGLHNMSILIFQYLLWLVSNGPDATLPTADS